MKVREKILETARKQFNQEGMKKVTARSICSQLEISPGSFSYHFPNKEKIVSELYQRMLGEIAELIQAIPRNDASVIYFLESHKRLFIIQNKYKFFFLNLFEILNSHEDIKTIYLQTAQMQQQVAKQLLELYVQQGVLKEGIAPKQFDRLVNVGQMLNNSWAIDAEINSTRSEEEQLIYYMNICCGLLEPYLTENAQVEYQAYFQELESTLEAG